MSESWKHLNERKFLLDCKIFFRGFLYRPSEKCTVIFLNDNYVCMLYEHTLNFTQKCKYVYSINRIRKIAFSF